MTSISESPYIFSLPRFFFFSSRKSLDRSRGSSLFIKNVRTATTTTTTTTTTTMTTMTRVREPPGFRRGGIRFFSPSRRVSPPPDRVRVPGRQKRATPCQKSRYVNAPRKPGLDRAAVLLVTGTYIYTG